MSNTLQSILGYVTLTGLIEKTKSGIPDPLPKGFSANPRRVIGDSGRYTQVTGQRRTARLAQYGAPARAVELKDVAARDIKLMHSIEKIALPPLVLQQLRNYTNYDLQNLGKQEVARQNKAFVTRFKNLRTAAKLMTLANGLLWFDAKGNLLPTSSGAVETIDFGVSANNQGQLNGTVTTSWDQASTDIPKDIRSIQTLAVFLTGYEIECAFYGKNVPSYITTNDFCQDYLARYSPMSEEFLRGGIIPNGLFGIKNWIPTFHAFFEDQNGTNQKIWGDDLITFTPSADEGSIGDWWEPLEGSYMVPTTINIQTDAAAAIASMKQVWGMFGFGIATVDPVGISTVYGDTFIDVLKNPDAIFQLTCKF